MERKSDLYFVCAKLKCTEQMNVSFAKRLQWFKIEIKRAHLTEGKRSGEMKT